MVERMRKKIAGCNASTADKLWLSIKAKRNPGNLPKLYWFKG